MAKILIAIDGTGEWSDEQYAASMKQSFVRQIYEKSAIPAKFYTRGPSVTGVDSGYYGLRALMDYLTALRTSVKRDPIEVYITGYSRGAMIAVYVANRIAQFNTLNRLTAKGTGYVKQAFGFSSEEPARISIKKMILFDAVDSDLTMYGPGISTIPDIAGQVIHFVCDATSTRLPRSRWYFSRIDLTPVQKVLVRRHACTHACIGGLPGQGDHRIPDKAGSLVQNAGQRFISQGPQAVANPGSAALVALGRAAAEKYDSVKSNVTLEEDFKAYDTVYREVVSVLGGFEITAFPRYRKEG